MGKLNNEAKKIKKWIWEDKKYPNVFFDISTNIEILALIEDIKNRKNILDGYSVFFDEKNLLNTKIETLLDEIINTSLIEGIELTRKSVRSSLRKKLDREFDEFADTHATRYTDHIADLFLDANLNKKPLSMERLHGWHNCLFEGQYSGLHKIRVADFRNEEIEVVSGPIGYEKVHYQGVPCEQILQDMEKFIDFCNNSKLNPYIKSSIAHLWFVVIHPYDDGNGRISRVIADYLLPKQENIKLYSLSTQINANKKEYYDVLEHTTNLLYNRDCNLNLWIKYHLKTIKHSMENGIKQVEKVIQKTRFWDKFKTASLNDRQVKVLNKMFDSSEDAFLINLNRYVSIAKTNKETAQNEINELLNLGCIKQVSNKSFAISVDEIKSATMLQTQPTQNSYVQDNSNDDDYTPSSGLKF